MFDALTRTTFILFNQIVVIAMYPFWLHFIVLFNLFLSLLLTRARERKTSFAGHCFDMTGSTKKKRLS